MSEHQIAAVTGHASIAQVQLYTKAANRKKLAAQAMADEVGAAQRNANIECLTAGFR